MVDYYYKYMKYKNKYLMIAGNGVRIHVSEPWFSLIFDGKKTIEGRPNKGIFKELKDGQTVTFFNKDLHKQYQVVVEEKHEYETFEDMIKTEGLENVLPNVETVSDGVNVYRQWYDEEVEKTYGIIGIKISVVSSMDNIDGGGIAL